MTRRLPKGRLSKQLTDAALKLINMSRQIRNLEFGEGLPLLSSLNELPIDFSGKSKDELETLWADGRSLGENAPYVYALGLDLSGKTPRELLGLWADWRSLGDFYNEKWLLEASEFLSLVVRDTLHEEIGDNLYDFLYSLGWVSRELLTSRLDRLRRKHGKPLGRPPKLDVEKAFERYKEIGNAAAVAREFDVTGRYMRAKLKEMLKEMRNKLGDSD